MAKAFNKTIKREFKSSFSRFISIIAIIALATAFIMGLMTISLAMQKSMGGDYRSVNMYDLNLKSSSGIYLNDIEELKQNDLVDNAMPFITTDILIDKTDKKSIATKIYGFEFDKFNDSSYNFINKFKIIEGRLPQNSGEVLIERSNNTIISANLGDKISVKQVKQEFSIDFDKDLTVVGVVGNSIYTDKRVIDPVSIGDGKLTAVLYADMSTFKNDMPFVGKMYTDAYVTLNKTTDLEYFNDSYHNFVKKSSDTILFELDKVDKDSNNPMVSSREWYALDLQTNMSYVNYQMYTDKIDSIAAVFPIFFLFVAALVALTTMTRMVEEDRTTIGTLKALGYSKKRIALKYILYGLIATLLGVGLGYLLGFSLLPKFIYDSFAVTNFLPKLTMHFDLKLAGILGGAFVGLTLIVTLFTVLNTLKESSSSLMRPKPPKKGQRILLERIGFIWKPLPFRYKATFRNIFRQKKQFLMTVVGVMGCVALLLAGLGINDSVKYIVDTQYKDIILYDYSVSYSSISDTNSVFTKLDEIGSALGKEQSYIDLYSTYDYVQNNDERFRTQIYVLKNDKNILEYVNLANRKTKQKIEFGKNSVVINEKMGELLDVKKGNSINVMLGNKEYSFVVTDLAENYMDSFIYIEEDYFTSVTSQNIKSNVLFVNGAEYVNKNEIVENLTSITSVSGVTFTYDVELNYADVLDSILSIVLLLVVVAIGLCVIVLYNLNNISISERKKELSTLKVLGYYDREVSLYIFRESIIMTIIGIVLGLLLGVLLHRFIIVGIDSYNMMMGRAVSWLTYVLSFGITLVSSIVVNLAMIPKIRKIDMATSMKSNE